MKKFHITQDWETDTVDIRITTTEYDPFIEWMPFVEQGPFIESFPMITHLKCSSDRLDEVKQILIEHGYQQD